MRGKKKKSSFSCTLWNTSLFQSQIFLFLLNSGCYKPRVPGICNIQALLLSQHSARSWLGSQAQHHPRPAPSLCKGWTSPAPLLKKQQSSPSFCYRKSEIAQKIIGFLRPNAIKKLIFNAFTSIINNTSISIKGLVTVSWCHDNRNLPASSYKYFRENGRHIWE